jgi:WD40 repeat protein
MSRTVGTASAPTDPISTDVVFTAPLMFAGTVSEDLKCPLCSKVLTEPSSIPCGHSFCRTCITNVLSRGSQQCPVCHKKPRVAEPVNTVAPNYTLALLVNQLLVHCRFGVCRQQGQWGLDVTGCPQVLPLEALPAHENECEWAKERCEHHDLGCPWVGSRSKRHIHSTSCGFGALVRSLEAKQKHWEEQMRSERQQWELRMEQQQACQKHELQHQIEQIKQHQIEGPQTCTARLYTVPTVREPPTVPTDAAAAEQCVGTTTTAAASDVTTILVDESRRRDAEAFVNQVPRIDGSTECRFSLQNGHSSFVWCMLICGRLLLSGSGDTTIKAWCVDTWKCKHTLEGHTDTVRCFAGASHMLVSGSTDQTIKVWSMDSLKCVHTLEGHTDSVTALQIVDQQMFSASWDKSIRVWSISQGWQCVHTIEQAHTDWIYGLALYGDSIVSASGDNTIGVWNAGSEFTSSRRLKGHTHTVSCLAIGSQRLFSGSYDKTIRAWEGADFECDHTLRGHTGYVHSLLLSGKQLMSASQDGMIRVWNLKSWQCDHVLEAHTDSVRCLAQPAYAGDHGKGDASKGFVQLISGSADHEIRVWQKFNN